MMIKLLPDGLYWVGFNEDGFSVAASIEKSKPKTSKNGVMAGCAQVMKCKRQDGLPLFGRHVSTFDIVEAGAR